MTLYELWFGKKPKLSFLKVWGWDAYVKKFQPDKLEPKSEKCVFIGYPKETIGYTFYHRSEGKIFVAKNGTFLEKELMLLEAMSVFPQRGRDDAAQRRYVFPSLMGPRLSNQ